jgi:serine/alanine adding enzyme
MRVVRQLDESRWRAFVDQHPRGNIFHTPEMYEVFSRAAGHWPELWAVIDGRSEILALLTPVHITLMPGLLGRLTRRSVVYGGALCRESVAGRQALRLLLRRYAEHVGGRSLFTELRNQHEPDATAPLFERCGYAYEGHLNYLIDLSRPSEEIFGAIGPRTRKHLRKGLRDQHVVVSALDDRAGLPEWYRLLQLTYQTIRVPLADPALFDAVFDVLQPRGMARFLMARVGDTPVACSLELGYKGILYGWYGGSDRAYSRYLPNELLTWHILEWGAAQGYRVYDFGGAGRPGEAYGVRDFKAKFGGTLVDFGRYTAVHAPRLLRLSKLGYALYQRSPLVARPDT